MKNKKIVFGAIDTYKSVTKYFMEKYDIAYIIDNDRNKQGKDFYGVKIYPVEKLLEEKKDEVDILIAVQSAKKEITAQLESFGFVKDKDFFFFYETYEKDTLFDYIYWRNVKMENGKYVPTSLHLELSGVCNLKCTYCPYHGFANIKDGHRKLMSWEMLIKIAEQVKRIPSIETLDVSGHGEIFLNRNWFEMLEYLWQETAIKNLVIYTNGMLLTEENVQKLANLKYESITLEVSIDGLSPEENNVYRKRSDYEIVKKNLEYALNVLSNDRFTKMITNSYVIEKEELERADYQINYYDLTMPLPEYLVKDFGNQVTIGTQPTNIIPNKNGELPQKSQGIEFVRVSTRYNGCCIYLFNCIAIDCEGNMRFCACAWGSLQSYANVMQCENLLFEFQNNKEMQLAREQKLNRIDSAACKNCPNSVTGFFIPVRLQKEIDF